MDSLINKHNRLIQRTKLNIIRYLYNELPWNERLVGIKGARGVGKTTLMLQYIKKEYGLSKKALYISLDNLYFSENLLSDFVDEFVAKGGEHLFIDEVHKYQNWSIELKNIYDFYPDLKVVFTGSSLLEILNSRADLSRRALVFKMQGLSFREFLFFRYQIKTDTYSLEQILEDHIQIALNISAEFKPLKYFDEYLRNGYYPFYENNEDFYYQKLQEIINMILEIELPLLRNSEISIIPKIKQLLYVLSKSVPFKPNVTALSNKINTTRRTVLTYIKYLEDASIFNLIYKASNGVGVLQKPDKLFLENTNLMYAIAGDIYDLGNIRETFFLNQLSIKYHVTYPENGDFMINKKYLFEVGGRSKTYKQIVNINNSFIAADGIESGVGNKIPLWLFGFMY